MLQQIAQAQAFWLQTPMGAQLVKPQHVHAVQARIAENAGFKNPGEFWSDPNTEPPPQMPPPQPDPKIVTTQMQLQADQQKTVATMQTEQQQFQAKLAFDAQQAQLDRESKERIEMAKLQFQYASKQADMDSAQQADPLPMVQQHVEPLAQQLQAALEALQELAARMEGGKTLGIEKLRGPDGRVIGGRIAYADGTSRDVSLN
jgi:cell division protein FtsN